MGPRPFLVVSDDPLGMYKLEATLPFRNDLSHILRILERGYRDPTDHAEVKTIFDKVRKNEPMPKYQWARLTNLLRGVASNPGCLPETTEILLTMAQTIDLGIVKVKREEGERG